MTTLFNYFEECGHRWRTWVKPSPLSFQEVRIFLIFNNKGHLMESAGYEHQAYLNYISVSRGFYTRWGIY